MYLHKDDKELLRDIIVTVSERTGIDESIVEKDYYVTMILKELVQRNPNVVFKGGTSLSKIAAEGEGKYFEIDSMQSLSQSVSSVSKNENVVQTYFIKNNDRKLYFNFIVAAAVLCLLAWILRRLFLQEVL